MTPPSEGRAPAHRADETMRARSRELHAWIDEFSTRYALDNDPTEVGPLQQAEYENATRAIEAKYSEHARDYQVQRVPVTLDARDAVILLLRRLSGRLSDPAEAAAWTTLADQGPAAAGPLVVDAVADQKVALTPAESRLVDAFTAAPGGFASDAEVAIEQDDVEILYYFDNWSEPQHETPLTRDGLDAALVSTAATLPGVQLVGRAWRSPAQHHSPGPATWVYVVVVDPGADTPRIRARLAAAGVAGAPFPYPVEVVEEGRDVPFYQAASRARAKRLWPDDPQDTAIRTRHWLHRT